MTRLRLTGNDKGCWLLEGELDSSSVLEVLGTSLTEPKGSQNTQVDLKGVTRADSAGLALLVEWLGEFERAGKQINFTHVPAQLLAIAGLCGLDEILSFNNERDNESNDNE